VGNFFPIGKLLAFQEGNRSMEYDRWLIRERRVLRRWRKSHRICWNKILL